MQNNSAFSFPLKGSSAWTTKAITPVVMIEKIKREYELDCKLIPSNILNAFKNSVAQGAGSSYMTFSGGWSKYSSAGQAARSALGTTYGWNITDGGLQT